MDGTKSPPLVSIIIPTYNHASYICDAIHSVVVQRYSHFEIIVVDDGSIDNTAEVVLQFGSRINYIRQHNQGLSAARNTGINAARGHYIGLLDADDMLEPDYLSVMVGVLESNKGFQGATCGYQFVDQRNQPMFEKQMPKIPPGMVYNTLLDHNPYVPESVLLHQECYRKAGLFDTSFRACEDWDMWLRVARDNIIIGTEKILTRHRVLDGSMSSDPSRMIKNRLAVAEKHFGPETGDAATWSFEKKRIYGGAYRVSCIEYFQYGDLDTAYTCFRKMASINPAMFFDIDTYYELGLGGQLKGQRGQTSSLSLAESSKIVFLFLDKLFQEHNAPGYLRKDRARIVGTANFSLGLLAYAAGDLSLTRAWLIKGFANDPRVITRKRFLTTLGKAYMGTSMLSRLRTIKGKF